MGREKRKPFLGEDRISRLENETDRTIGLLEFMSLEMPGAKRNDLKRWLKYGHISVGGVVTTQFDTPIEPGMAIEFNQTRPFVRFQNRRVEIVYEDDDIIVANKGYGLLSVSTGRTGTDGKIKKEETAYNILKDYVKAKSVRNRLYVVHRLDRDTSGLMLFAKTEEARDTLRRNWNNIILSRKYVAVVEGQMEQEEGEIRTGLSENSAYRVYASKSKKGAQGRTYSTRYKVLQKGRSSTLVEFELDSSGKNQIRVHAAEMGHPIVGDKKYGGSTSSLHRLALHARTLDFAHPISRKYMQFEAPIPTKFIGFVRHS